MKKIMFVMLRTLGDVMLGTTLAHELKKEFPDSEIHFYTNPPYNELLINNPDIYEIHCPRSHGWIHDMIFMDMAVRDYDLVFAPYQMRGECNVWHQNEATRHQHLLDFYWRRMGMHRPIIDRECYLFPLEADYIKAREHITLDTPRIAIHATTGVATKDWPHFAEMVEELRKSGYGVIQVGAHTDNRIEGAIDLRGRMGLLELAALLSQCAVFIGLDSGVSYIADTMKTPSIIIQGSTNPITSGPISPRVIHLFAEETGYPDCQQVRCHGNCRHEINCINKITVGRVMSEIDKILQSWEPPIPVAV